jgi:hypothetical protein
LVDVLQRQLDAIIFCNTSKTVYSRNVVVG